MVNIISRSDDKVEWWSFGLNFLSTSDVHLILAITAAGFVLCKKH